VIDTRAFNDPNLEEEEPLEGGRLIGVVAITWSGPASLLFFSMPASLTLACLALGFIAGLTWIPRIRTLAAIGLLLLLFGVDPLVARQGPDIPTRDWQPVLLTVSAMMATCFSPRLIGRLLNPAKRRLRRKRKEQQRAD
jgi:hypothetical protein